ncbi:PD-(D/E)XK nuclease family protein [Cesiribacter andamanensis]|uniref:Inactivated superfamily I helicase n=1 Tax=Cesiribacter andamanensis AMV16 TaxID=1279009 RepID=M7N3X8_9BACT|nr:PD-(D/E)XK nuclease family protein [Cesiribacter andamanensis]EMR01997.1 Inactivated superfamily I helicase [Cesiribacter andamanensis AMV16]
MRTFLEELASEVLTHYPDQLDGLTLVFPNRRAGLFFQQYLAGQLNQPVWSPQVLTLEEFIGSLSPLKKADGLLLVFELFEIYKSLAPTDESFDKFFFWGEMLLQDFDAVDQHLVDARLLFTNIVQLNALDGGLDFLSEEQITVVQEFWQHFGTANSRQKQEFIAIWEILPQVYARYRQRLQELGIGYQGLQFRQVAEACRTLQLEHPYRHVVFAGFNALTPAEESVLSHFIKNEGARMYWDTDAYYLQDLWQEAGHFLRRHARSKILGPTFPPSPPAHLKGSNKYIEFIGVPLEVGQAKAMGEKLLHCLQEQQGLKLERTAIVLPDEHMLFPVLHSIPEQYTDSRGSVHPIDTVNVTMGYPLRSTPLFSLIELMVELQGSARGAGAKAQFHFRTVLALLRHPYIYYVQTELARENIHAIEAKNRVYLSASELKGESPLYTTLFRRIEGIQPLFDYLLQVLELINESINEENYEQPTLEQEYIYQFFTHLKRLRELVQQQRLQLQMPVFLKLLRQIVQEQRLPFTGEPLSGLQIMGVLETRLLDFENLFILSMNEGTFPPAPSHGSFIPYNLRRGWGLPTFDQQDALYAYYFYRMLQRAKNVHIFYNTSSAYGLNGERSRLLYQLLYESGLPVRQQVLTHPLQLARALPLEIPKSQGVWEVLQQHLSLQGDPPARRFTPSALNTYLDCRLRFYFRYVAGIQEPDEVQEEVDPAVFGNLVHRAMELLYLEHIRDSKGGVPVLEPEDLRQLHRGLPAVVDRAFAEHYGVKEVSFEGRNHIVRSIVEKLGSAILRCDEEYAPFEIIALESESHFSRGERAENRYRMEVPIRIGGQAYRVGLKGIIDRIDRKEGKVRILDYKTGQDEKRFESLASLFERDNLRRNKAAMQTLLYSLLYLSAHPQEEARVIPGLYNSRELFSPGFDVRLEIKGERGYQPVQDVRDYADDYLAQLRSLLEELFDPAIPFTQTENLRKCEYCAYRGMCHR